MNHPYKPPKGPKAEICKRLGHDWQRLSVYVGGQSLYRCVRCGVRDVRTPQPVMRVFEK